jgi:hypothetical protein
MSETYSRAMTSASKPTIASVFEQKKPDPTQLTHRRIFGLTCAFPSKSVRGGVWKDEELSEEVLAEMEAVRAEADARAEAAAEKRRELEQEAARKRQEEKEEAIRAVEREAQHAEEEAKAQAEAAKFAVFKDLSNANASAPKKR